MTDKSPWEQARLETIKRFNVLRREVVTQTIRRDHFLGLLDLVQEMHERLCVVESQAPEPKRDIAHKYGG